MHDNKCIKSMHNILNWCQLTHPYIHTACAANCLSCTVVGQCTSGQCSLGFMSGTNNDCVPCAANCDRCTVAGQCTSGSCTSGYRNADGGAIGCVACLDAVACDLCSAVAGGLCDPGSCRDGYTDGVNGTCDACPSNCLQCTTDTLNCTADGCRTGYAGDGSGGCTKMADMCAYAVVMADQTSSPIQTTCTSCLPSSHLNTGNCAGFYFKES